MVHVRRSGNRHGVDRARFKHNPVVIKRSRDIVLPGNSLRVSQIGAAYRRYLNAWQIKQPREVNTAAKFRADNANPDCFPLQRGPDTLWLSLNCHCPTDQISVFEFMSAKGLQSSQNKRNYRKTTTGFLLWLLRQLDFWKNAGNRIA